MHTHAFRNRQEGLGGGRELRDPPQSAWLSLHPQYPSSPFGLDHQTLGSSRALGGARKSSTWSPVEGACCSGIQGRSVSYRLAGQRGVCGGGAGGIGICRGTVGCLCTQGRGVVWEMESQSLEAWYPKRRSIIMCLPFLASFSSFLSDRV